jgi:malonate-semialdehyde dehydrogenase (acetylating) / methylmalonate-semialdehyde dehydrogenase
MATVATGAGIEDVPLFINGVRRVSSGATEQLLNPATGAPNAVLYHSTSDEIDAAVQAAYGAFPAWSATPVLQRCRVFFHFHAVLEKHADELIRMVTEENGKTLEEAKGSFARGLECVEFAAGATSLMMGDTVENVGTGVDGYSIRQPLGVCAGITPFNFPFMVPLWMYPMAIACGNTFVLKPSERVPRTAVRTAELLHEAGLPPGVLNVVHGTKSVVDAILNHPKIRAVSFVGSSVVAKYIYSTAAANGKRVQALGGAKNHSVVMPDADLKNAAQVVMASSFGCAGERCVATSVVVAVGDIADNLVAELKTLADEMKVGDGSEKGTVMGPVITTDASKRIAGYIEKGLDEGARLVRDGRKDSCTKSEGNFLGPTIFDNVSPQMKIAREEIFGPVLSVVRVNSMEEALHVIQGSQYGNASSIFTRSGKTAREFVAKAQTGMVGVNVGVPAPTAIFPFAGWRGSFFGDLHALGKDSVQFYTESKVVTARWPEN